MPIVYLRKNLYDRIIREGKDVTEYVNAVVEEALFSAKSPRGPEPKKTH